MHGGTGGENMNGEKQEKDFWEVKCSYSKGITEQFSWLIN